MNKFSLLCHQILHKVAALRLQCPTNEEPYLRVYVDITKTVLVEAVILELAVCPENARICFNQMDRKKQQDGLELRFNSAMV